jgi:hypothetical protein
VLSALSQAQDTGTADQLAAEVDCDPRWTADDGGTAQIIDQLSTLACDKDPGVRDEARRILGSSTNQDDAHPTN